MGTSLHDWIFFYNPFFAFVIGACVGSFLNVVMYRYPLGRSVVSPGSACPNCEHDLAWYDNVPVFGWMWLLGKCRYCKIPISPRYPFYEALYGLTTALAIWWFPIQQWQQGLATAGLILAGTPMVLLLIRHRKAPWYLILVSLAAVTVLVRFRWWG
ncbi:prepilin peptidase [Acanthopleuribacter pedis]|uniref:Prepilin peptidase n=1 Tax=Acanthopleuribacter pedis TaxID=442870 RepID=A0A8J7U6T1_9BACT|nr:prepilin peptidase [Acanthopleuribacter pedis]MBO1322259.1 prepilin peptidase [Acanthopleuribacter pedis]